MALALPLSLRTNNIRFRSLVNQRIFTLLFIKSYYFLLELDADSEHAIVMDVLYQGRNVDKAKMAILMEVCDV